MKELKKNKIYLYRKGGKVQRLLVATSIKACIRSNDVADSAAADSVDEGPSIAEPSRRSL